MENNSRSSLGATKTKWQLWRHIFLRRVPLSLALVLFLLAVVITQWIASFIASANYDMAGISACISVLLALVVAVAYRGLSWFVFMGMLLAWIPLSERVTEA